MIYFPTNGIGTKVSAANRSSASAIRNEPEELSVIAYDHLGKYVSSCLLADLVPDVNVKRTVLKINTSDRRIINKLQKNKEKVIWRESDTEIDNNSDTNCFGENFQIPFTSEECTVSPLLS